MKDKISEVLHSKSKILILFLTLIVILEIYQIGILKSQINNLQWHCANLESKIDTINENNDTLRVDSIEDRIDTVESKINDIEVRGTDLEHRIEESETERLNNSISINELEYRIKNWNLIFLC